MTYKELLELAAKAAGIELRIYGGMDVEPGTDFVVVDAKTGFKWNPLTDDGDALRLAVKLKMFVDIGDHFSEAAIFVDDERIGAEVHHQTYTPEEATRRAIVRAAAEIGRGME
jgi:hypothetical protein